MIDVYDLWEAQDIEKERRLARRPICSNCDQRIQDEEAYLINGEVICQKCLDRDFKIWVEEYVDDLC